MSNSYFKPLSFVSKSDIAVEDKQKSNTSDTLRLNHLEDGTLDSDSDDSLMNSPDRASFQRFGHESKLESDKHIEQNNSYGKDRIQGDAIVSRYGMGAKLLMSMGYKEGEGLGANKEGISKPIETRMRPQGLGLGGVQEREYETESSDEDDKTPIFVEQSSIDFYKLIDDLESNDIKVPHKYKLVSNKLGSMSIEQKKLFLASNEVTEMYEKLKKVGQTLLDMKDQYNSKVSESSLVQEELSNKRHEIETKADLLKISRSFKDDLEIEYQLKNRIILTTKYLNQLKQYSASSISRNCFFAFCDSIIQEVFESEFLQSFDHSCFLIETLTEWSMIFRELAGQDIQVELEWDTYIYVCFKKNCQIFCEDQNNTTDDSKIDLIIRIIDCWINSSVLITANFPFKTRISEELLQKYFLKWVMSNRDISGYVTVILRFINQLSISIDHAFSVKFVQKVIEEYEKYFKGIQDSYYTSKDNSNWHERSFLSELEFFSLVALPFIQEVVNNSKIEKLQNVLTITIVEYFQNEEFWKDSKKFRSEFARLLEICNDLVKSRVIEASFIELILQFKFFNPWLKYFKDMVFVDFPEDRMKICSFIRTWYDEFSSVFKDLHFIKDIRPMTNWYFNNAIFLLNMNSSSNEVNLPSLYGNSDVSVSSFINYLKSVTPKQRSNNYYDGIAYDTLLATFKDVVDDYCIRNNILFTSQPSLFHPTLGLQLYKLECNMKIIWGFISDDVLYIVKEKDEINNPQAYIPTDLESLLAYFK